jgi:hypothetical protein
MGVLHLETCDGERAAAAGDASGGRGDEGAAEDDVEGAGGAEDVRSSSSDGAAVVGDAPDGAEEHGVEPGGERVAAERRLLRRIDLQGLGIRLLYRVLVVLRETGEDLVPSHQDLRLLRRPSSSNLSDAAYMLEKGKERKRERRTTDADEVPMSLCSHLCSHFRHEHIEFSRDDDVEAVGTNGFFDERKVLTGSPLVDFPVEVFN